MRDSSVPLRVGVLGHVGNGNLGDEALIAAVIQNVRDRRPDAEIIGLTIHPDDTVARHGIPSFPIRRMKRRPEAPAASGAPERSGSAGSESSATARVDTVARMARRRALSVPGVRQIGRLLRSAAQLAVAVPAELVFLVASRRRVGRLDLLLIAGSQQVNDFVSGPWGFPYTLLKWVALARLAGARVAFLSVGAGPIETRLGRLFLRLALAGAFHRSVRDETSRIVVRSLDPMRDVPVVPDLVFSLRLPPREKTAVRSRGRKVVGINPMPLFHSDYWHQGADERYRAYVGAMARFAIWLIDRGYAVRLFGTQSRVDHLVAADVRRAVAAAGDVADHLDVLDPVADFSDLARTIRELDFVVATRYHGILLSVLLERPVLALAYHPKSRDLMVQLGQGDHVLDSDTLTDVGLGSAFVRLERGAVATVAGARGRLPELRGALACQYDFVLAGTSDRTAAAQSSAAPLPAVRDAAAAVS